MGDLRYNQLEKVGTVVASVSQTLVAMTAGTTYTGILTPSPILDSNHDGVGGLNNNSISFTNSVFLVEKAHTADLIANGDYFLNYKSGYYKVIAGASATAVASWYVKNLTTNTSVTVTSAAVTVADGANVVEGAVADAAVTTSASGTISAKLRGIISLLVSKINVKTADGDAVTIGTTTDTGVVSDTTGTVIGFLRGIVKILSNVWVSASNWLQVQVQASENHIGSVGGNSVIASDIMVRPNDTTQYTTLDVVGVNIAVVGVTAHSGDGYCLVQVGASIINTTIKTGDHVTIASVQGTTEANGSNYITVISATTFTIPVAFVNTYTSGGTIARKFQMDLARVNNGTYLINYAKLKMQATVLTNFQFDLYHYNAALDAILDNSTSTVLYANTGEWLGTFLPISGTTGSGGTGSDTVHAIIPSINMVCQAPATNKKGFFRLVMTATTGYIPVANTSITLIIGAVQD